MYDYNWNPYTIDPSSYTQQALAPQQGGQPVMPQMQAEQKYFGPMHQALGDYFQQGLGQQLAMPGLLSEMQNNPALAQQVGGLLGSTYTPAYYAPNRIDWQNAKDVAKNMPKGWGDGTKGGGGGRHNTPTTVAPAHFFTDPVHALPTTAASYGTYGVAHGG